MLNKKELAKFVSLRGFNLWQIEKDYLQQLFLFFLAQKTSDELIFKGGTALQKAYGLNRFSIDLDFTEYNTLPNDLFKHIGDNFTAFGFETTVKETMQKDSVTIKCVTKGPLYMESEKSMSLLKIDISIREKAILGPETKEIFPVYPDIPPYLVRIMPMEEILAEKVRAIMTRNKARDLFDIRFLLKKGALFNKKLIDEKLKYYNLTFSWKSFIEAVQKIEPIWVKELSQLTAPVPDFKVVENEIKHLKQLPESL